MNYHHQCIQKVNLHLVNLPHYQPNSNIPTNNKNILINNNNNNIQINNSIQISNNIQINNSNFHHFDKTNNLFNLFSSQKNMNSSWVFSSNNLTKVNRNPINSSLIINNKALQEHKDLIKLLKVKPIYSNRHKNMIECIMNNNWN